MSEPMPVGRLALHISGGIGSVIVSLWPREAPKACRNFVQLAMEGYYEDCAFTRVVPGFMAQSGDPTNTGAGGDSIWDEPFQDEISQRLKFNRRGILAMANLGTKNSNASQFFLTLDSTPQLNGRNTIFGCVDVSGASGDTLFNLLKFNEIEIQGEKPVYPPVIKSVEVIDNPFDDIEVRITASERREQIANKKAARKEAKQAAKRKQGVKNNSLLSFDAEPEEAPPSKGGKMKSAHDLLEDSRLSKEVKDDRGLSAALPSSFQDMPSSSASTSTSHKSKSKRAKESPGASSAEPAPKPSKKQKTDAEERPPSSTSNRQAEIDALQASLLGTRKRDKKPEEAQESTENKKDASRRSGAELIAAQREQYLNSGKAQRGRKRASAAAGVHPARKALMGKQDDSEGGNDAFKAFQEELRQKRKDAASERKAKGIAALPDDRPDPEAQQGYAGEVLEDEDVDDNDMSFLSHSLKFRKDVTAERNQMDELVTIDPREERAAAGREFTLEDAKHEEERRRRHGQVPSTSTSRRYDDDRRPSRRGGDGRERDWKGREVGAEGKSSDRRGGGGGRDRYERSPRRPGEGW